MSELQFGEIELREPVDLARSLEVFRRPGDDLIDRFDGERLIRSTPQANGFAPYLVSIEPGLKSSMMVAVARRDGWDTVRESVGGIFVSSTDDWPRLLSEDAILRRLADRWPGLRPVRQHDLFTALVRSISAQQINLRWASTIRARLAERYGDRHEIGDTFVYSLNVHRIAEANPADIRALQFTTQKAESIVLLAQEFATGRLHIGDLERMADEGVIERLVRLRGIGLWSAEWILSRTLGRPRVVAGDLGVRKAVGLAYGGGILPSEEEVRSLTAHWGESANVAQALLLQAIVAGATK